MNVNVNFVYTAAAQAALAKHPPKVTSFSVSSLDVLPLQDDLVMFSDENDAPLFRVVNRLFIWQSDTDLILQPLLDYEPPAGDQGTSA